MYLQIATLCDSAYEYGGQVCMLGTFDTIEAKEFPVVKTACSYVFQVRWEEGEEGNHIAKAVFTNEKGEQTLAPMESKSFVKIPDGGKITTTNYIINLRQLQFNTPGLFTASLYVDEQFCGSAQLQVVKMIDPILFSGVN